MTEEEYKFLEVIYNRGSIQEQPYINYLSGTLPESLGDKDQYIRRLFSKFRDYGFIDSSNSGMYRITELGKEKFEEVNDRRESSRTQTERSLLPKLKFIRPNRRFWLALAILIIIVSIISSMILNRWTYLSDAVNRIAH